MYGIYMISILHYSSKMNREEIEVLYNDTGLINHQNLSTYHRKKSFISRYLIVAIRKDINHHIDNWG